jgi:hypothetical protein
VNTDTKFRITDSQGHTLVILDHPEKVFEFMHGYGYVFVPRDPAVIERRCLHYRHPTPEPFGDERLRVLTVSYE